MFLIFLVNLFQLCNDLFDSCYAPNINFFLVSKYREWSILSILEDFFSISHMDFEIYLLLDFAVILILKERNILNFEYFTSPTPQFFSPKYFQYSLFLYFFQYSLIFIPPPPPLTKKSAAEKNTPKLF